MKIIPDVYLWTKNILDVTVSRSGNFLKDSSTLWDGHFFTIWLVSLHVLIGSSHEHFTTKQGSPSSVFENHPDMKSGSGVWINILAPDTDSKSRPDSPWQRHAVSDCSCFICNSFTFLFLRSLYLCIFRHPWQFCRPTFAVIFILSFSFCTCTVQQ